MSWTGAPGGSTRAWGACGARIALARVPALEAPSRRRVAALGRLAGALALLAAPEAHAAGVPFAAAQTVSAATDAPRNLAVADLDGDGDPDALSASRFDGTIAWYPNRGGQFALPTADTVPSPPPLLFAGMRDDVLRIDLAHRGRAGDSDAELAAIHLRITGGIADAHLDEIALHADDGSGSFEAAQDPAVASASAASADGLGNLTLAFADADPNARVSAGQTRRYFAVLEADAPLASPGLLSVTHVTASTSTAEDAASDLPLQLEFHADTSSGDVFVTHPGLDFDGDGLEDVHETDTGVYASPTDTGTDPFDPDTDDDGLLDAAELAAGADPFDPDSDDDGLSDAAEVNLHGSDPTDSDSDDDGIGDAVEIARGSDPTDPGDPFFQPSVTLAAGVGGIQSLAVGDSDFDGDVDVFAVEAGPGAYWLRNESPRLTSVVVEQIVDENGSVGVAADLGQIDGTGNLDLALGGGVDYAKRVGPGPWDPASGCGRIAIATTLHDWDDDGDLDLVQVYVAGIPYVVNVAVCRNPLIGGGSWSAGFPLWIDIDYDLLLLAADVAVTDTQVIGIPQDVIVASGGTVWVLGIFAEIPITGFTTAVALAVADFDEDGNKDIAVADRDGGTISWVAGPDFTSVQTIDGAAIAATDVVAGDLDGDGHVDLAATMASGDLRWYRNEGGGSWSTKILDDDASALGLAAADVDADGDSDLLVAVSPDVRLYRNGPLAPEVPGLGPPGALALAVLLAGIGALVPRLRARRA